MSRSEARFPGISSTDENWASSNDTKGDNFYPLRIRSDGQCNAYIRGQPSRMAGAKESYERRGRDGRVKRLTRENDRELSEKRGNPKVQ